MGFSNRNVRSVNQERDKSGHLASSVHLKVSCLLSLRLYNVFLLPEVSDQNEQHKSEFSGTGSSNGNRGSGK